MQSEVRVSPSRLLHKGDDKEPLTNYIYTMTVMLAPSTLSNFLLCESRERGEILTNLKLQKLLYYAQAWHLALFNQKLFDEDFEAWVHGPVLPSEYRRFRDYKWRPITEEVERPEIAKDLIDFLDEIVDVFGSETAVALELMTHRERPWMEARGDLAPAAPSTRTISKETMRDYYSELGAS